MDPITLAALADFPNQLEAYYSAVPNQYKNWRPTSWVGVPSEPFTPIEQVCHVKDIEIDGYHRRLRRILEESNPLLDSLDGEALARERSYSTANTTAVFAQFRDARTKTIELVSKLTPEQLQRAAQFEGHRVTLRGLVHNLCSHDQQHLAGIQWLLSRMAASTPTGSDSVNTLIVQGGCLCGAIRYRVEGVPSSISICHCRSCRLASGAPAVSWFVVLGSQFKLLSGVLTVHQSSKPVHRGFCRKCGTQLTYEHESAPDSIELTTASLDQPGCLQPTKEIWLSHKLPWAAVNANLEHHSEDAQAT